MELSYQLQTLEPLTGALDIIRFFGKVNDLTADATEIQEALELSDRTFDKAMRRLVTKGYVQMDGNRVYRLTEQGQRAVEEIAAYDETASLRGDVDDAVDDAIQRRLVVAVPSSLVAGKPAAVAIGIDTNGQPLAQPADIVARLSVINGEPKNYQDTALTLGNAPLVHTFQVTAGAYTQARIRLEIFQMDQYSGDISLCGGMYIDVNVTAAGTNGSLIAYGADLKITPTY